MAATRKDTRRAGKVAKCLTCPNKSKSRGLCERCLAAARAKINSGEITEAELIEAGLMLTAKRRGPKAESGFAKAFAAKVKST